YYDAHKGRLGEYWEPRRVRIEYAQVMFEPIETSLTVSVDEMRDYYDKHKDLYQMKTGEGDQAKTEEIPFLDVKPQIEATLKRAKAREKALKMLTTVREACEGPKAETPAEEKPDAETPEKPAGTPEKPAETPPATKTLEEAVKALKDPAVSYFTTPELTEPELLDVPNIGIASVAGKGLAQLAFELKADDKRLSPVMSSTEGMFVMRPAAAPVAGRSMPLAEVRPRVVDDWRNAQAFEKAMDAADAFYRVAATAGAGDFEKLALDKKLVDAKLPQTELFVNNYFDANRPAWAQRELPYDLGELYGPMPDAESGVVVVAKVTGEREADRSAFQADRARERATVLAAKIEVFAMTGFPRNVLKMVDFKRIVHETPIPPEAPPDFD
ncbi:MAG TPA: hypothetical protein VMX57_07070, partial [Planctomycetota bacterium]|nr:hypothetical protein [Planctomycetota bacterium]